MMNIWIGKLNRVLEDIGYEENVPFRWELKIILLHRTVGLVKGLSESALVYSLSLELLAPDVLSISTKIWLRNGLASSNSVWREFSWRPTLPQLESDKMFSLDLFCATNKPLAASSASWLETLRALSLNEASVGVGRGRTIGAIGCGGVLGLGGQTGLLCRRSESELEASCEK